MKDEPDSGAAEHQEISALIPWYVNDTLDDAQCKRLEAHLTRCAECRGDLQLERQVQSAMTGAAEIEYLAAPSLKRLQAQLDALGDREAAVGAASTAAAIEAPEARRRPEIPWRSLMAASVVTIAIAFGVVAIRAKPPSSMPGAYYTVTSSAPRAPDEIIRAVFAPTITLTELQTILGESQLRIVGGPSEAGVYSLAASSKLSVSASLKSLREHAAVRFAESTQVIAASDEPR